MVSCFRLVDNENYFVLGLSWVHTHPADFSGYWDFVLLKCLAQLLRYPLSANCTLTVDYEELPGV